MNLYEHTIIARQDTSPSELKQLTEKYSKIVEKNDGKVVQTQNWGLINLSYIIKKNKKGNYIHFKFEGPAKIVSDLEKNESMDRCRTLPSHYTLTHYVSGKDPNVFYHPAKDLLSIVNPDLEEWSTARSLYINEGDVIIHPSYLEYSTPQVEKQRITITLLFNIEKIPA